MANISEWLDAVTHGDSGRKVAKRAGIHPATLNRQISEGSLTPETVARIARAYSGSIVDGLLALELLTDSDIDVASTERALSRATDEQLIAEVMRRMKAGSNQFDQPLSELDTPESDISTRSLGLVADYQPGEPIDTDQDDSRYEP